MKVLLGALIGLGLSLSFVIVKDGLPRYWRPASIRARQAWWRDKIRAGLVEWLSAEYGLGRGHGMAMVHVITKGDQISSKHVDSGGTHSDPKDHLWLDGVASKPEGY